MALSLVKKSKTFALNFDGEIKSFLGKVTFGPPCIHNSPYENNSLM